MESLNGDFVAYINNADEDDVQHIVSWSDLFKRGKYKYTGHKEDFSKWTGKERKSDLILLNPIKNDFEKLGIQMCL